MRLFALATLLSLAAFLPTAAAAPDLSGSLTDPVGDVVFYSPSVPDQTPPIEDDDIDITKVETSHEGDEVVARVTVVGDATQDFQVTVSWRVSGDVLEGITVDHIRSAADGLDITSGKYVWDSSDYANGGKEFTASATAAGNVVTIRFLAADVATASCASLYMVTTLRWTEGVGSDTHQDRVQTFDNACRGGSSDGAASPPGTTTPTPDGTGAPTSGTQTTTGTPTTAGSGASSSSNGTPGFEVAFLVVAALAALAIRRK